MQTAPRRAALAFIYVTVLLDMLAFGLAIPVLAFLYRDLAGGDTARGAVASGWFGLAFAIMQFAFAPVLGALSDRFGRRPVLVLSNLGLAGDYALMALAPNLAWLFVGRLYEFENWVDLQPARVLLFHGRSQRETRSLAYRLLRDLFAFRFEIGDDEPLFGDRFGLDSIDAVELVFQLKKHFGVIIQNQSEGRSFLQSVNTICAFIEKRQGA